MTDVPRGIPRPRRTQSAGATEAEILAALDPFRCPGCGNVTVPHGENRAGCHDTSDVDITQPGYQYLAKTWGWCFTLSRNIGIDEEPYADFLTGRTGVVAAS